MNPIENLKIGFIGLGYAGLPTACLLAEKYPLIGYDIKAERVEHLLSSAEDKHINHSQIHHLIEKGMMLTSDEEQLRDCNFYIIVVPTPIDFHNRPDLSFVTEASKTVGKYLKKDDNRFYLTSPAGVFDRQVPQRICLASPAAGLRPPAYLSLFWVRPRRAFCRRREKFTCFASPYAFSQAGMVMFFRTTFLLWASE